MYRNVGILMDPALLNYETTLLSRITACELLVYQISCHPKCSPYLTAYLIPYDGGEQPRGPITCDSKLSRHKDSFLRLARVSMGQRAINECWYAFKVMDEPDPVIGGPRQRKPIFSYTECIRIAHMSGTHPLAPRPICQQFLLARASYINKFPNF